MLELDLVLMPFLDNVYFSLGEEDQLRYQRLLECEDPELYKWFMKKSDPEDPELLKIVQIIRDNTGLQG